MTIIEDMIEKRASLERNLLGVFKKEEEGKYALPIVRNSIYRGNSGQDHIIRKGEETQYVERVATNRKEKSESTVRRLLGLFGSDE